MSLWRQFKRHPGWIVLGFLVWGFPIGFLQAWPALVRDRTLPEWLAERGLPRLSVLLAVYLTAAFLSTTIVVLIALTKKFQLQSARLKASNPPEHLNPVRRFGIHWDSEQNPLCPVDDTFLAMTEHGVLQATGKYFEVFHCPKCKTDYRLRDDKGNPVRIGFAKDRVRLKI
jgi:hypothetical protein